MYVLVLIAYMVGEAPVVRASPNLYPSYDACLYEAANAMTATYRYLPEEIKDKVSIVHMCTAVSEDA
jgi:hypothetical protein